MRGMRNSEKVVDQATIFPMENRKVERVYIGISAGNRKLRFYNDSQSFFQLSTQKANNYQGVFPVWEIGA